MTAMDDVLFIYSFCSSSVFDDGDVKSLRRGSLCLKGDRHFNESEVSMLVLSILNAFVEAKLASGLRSPFGDMMALPVNAIL